MATLSFRVPDALYRDLERMSSTEGISKSAIVRAALNRYLRVGKFRAIQNELAPIAEGFDIETDSDVFRILKDD